MIKNNTKKALSLIVLVVTIIVLGILASTLIISIGNTNIITKSRITKFKNDMREYQEAYSIWYAKEVAANGYLYSDDSSEVNNISYADNKAKFVEIFGNNLPEEYLNNLIVKNGKVLYYTTNEEKVKVLEELQMIPNSSNITIETANCSLESLTTTILPSSKYTNRVIVNEGYTLADLTVVVKMDGSDITSASYNSTTGDITIEKVTGNIEIMAKYVMPTYADGTWDSTKGVNRPTLGKGMTGVYWDADGVEVEITSENASSWYDYSNQKWANAKTADGSYWVWIPRYAYKFNSGRYTETAGTILIEFLQGITDKDSTNIIISKTYPSWSGETMESYVVHPVFINDSSSNYMHGGWDAELPGIWVAKYEMSNDGSNNILSKPGVQSWRNITIGDIYTKCINYNTAFQSHLMKNSEWGAVAYLAQSIYGRNGVEVTINSNSSYYTGGSSGATANTNVLQSTTGNNTGVFDMSGGSWEYVAGYISDGNGNINTYGSSFAYTSALATGYLTQSTKYVTVYPYNSSSNSNTNNYTEYKNAAYGYGDAILETSTSGSGSTSWFSDYSYFANGGSTFFLRSGNYNNGMVAGLFYFYYTNGFAYNYYSFRAVLVVI